MGFRGRGRRGAGIGREGWTVGGIKIRRTNAIMKGEGDAAARLLAAVGAAPEFSGRLGKILSGTGGPVGFGEVARPAFPFLVALIGRAVRERRPGANLWVMCGDVRIQEEVDAGIRTWGCEGLFLPELDIIRDETALPDPEAMAERLNLLYGLGKGDGGGRTVILHEESLGDDVPLPGEIVKRARELRAGEELDLGEMADALVEAGYDRVSQVTERGQFAVRGGILDVYSPHHDSPVRVELFGDEIESVRVFDIHTQGSVGKVKEAEVLLRFGDEEREFCEVRDYIREGDVTVALECPAGVEARVRVTAGSAGEDGVEEECEGAVYESPLGGFGAGDFVLQQAKREQFFKQVEEWHRGGWSVTMFFNNRGEIERFRELVGDEVAGDTGNSHGGCEMPRRALPELAVGHLAQGFAVPAAKVAVLSDAEIFGRYQTARANRMFRRDKRQAQARTQASIQEYKEGDLVVHADHGIGRFRGIGLQPGREEEGNEALVVEYANGSKLYVPLEHAHLVSRYVGSGPKAPPLNALGDKRWARTRQAAEKSILDYAGQLLTVQAERDTAKGYAHLPDTKWQHDFENSFLYRETPDQLRAIEDAKMDMESARPMDRLVCGDVGFGKTEVAIRAAFKSVMGGRQVAMLVPTTVLAEQHWRTFRERMSDYPVNVEMLSRFRSPKQQREVLKGMADGTVDIVIGTHRLVSKDVAFKELGLVVVDEEQRFGVKVKERFKEMFRLVDVLTLSATPIPRTLYLSLMGVRDMSNIETPPANRYPVQTTICAYDRRVIQSAIERELHREGQVFYLHNRVEDIVSVKRMVEELCPGARVEFGHGQMDEHMLEDVMHRFVRGETDVLVCTTIIESGVDIPNANTMIIDRADRFGLADLYQLRGRVGRAQRKAYAILMLPPHLLTTGDAKKRISAIRQHSSLGAGFKIAMRDLEIRGAGNLLGLAQSGHIAAVGFDLYCKLLRASIDRLGGRGAASAVSEVAVRIDFLGTGEAEYMKSPKGVLPAFIPSRYMPEARMRISAYRAVAEVATYKELAALERSWRDRFGKKMPEAVENFLACAELKLAAAQASVTAVEIRDGKLMLTRNGGYVQYGGKFPRLEAKGNRGKLLEAVKMLRS